MIKDKETLPRKVRNLFGELVDSPIVTKAKKGHSPGSRRSKKSYVKQASLFDNQILSDEEKLLALKEIDEGYREKLEKMSFLASNLGLKLTFSDDNNPLPKVFIEHPLFKSRAIEARWYSLAIANKAIGKNSIIVIPTGLGKTYIFFLLLPLIIAQEPEKKIILLCPTKPLCEQHYRTMTEIIKVKTAIIFGQTSPKKRLKIWQENQVIIATPQTILAELKKNSGLGKPEDIKLAVFDEIHHASKEHAYAKLAAQYAENPNCVIHNLTASPDHEIDTIRKWQKLLKVDDHHLLVRNYESLDVRDYVHLRHIKAISLPTVQSGMQIAFHEKLVNLLDGLFSYINSQLKLTISNMAYHDSEGRVIGVKFKELDELRKKVSDALDQNKNRISWEKKKKAYEILRDLALLVAFSHAVSVNDKGLAELTKYLQKQYHCLLKNPRQFQRCLCENYEIKSIVTELYINRLWKVEDWPSIIYPKPPERNPDTRSWQQALIDSKLPKLIEIIEQSNSSQFIIFTNKRDTLHKVVYYLKNKLSQKRVGVLTGMSSNFNDPGLSHKDQISTLNDFRDKKIDILVSTSVGEEGLDFPSVDAVIFFEPIVEIRRYIQRLGRTARHRDGTVYILMFKGTEEEKMYFISRGRENKVKQIIELLERKN